MQLSREMSHRLTAILCTLVAVAILAAGVTAQHENAEPIDKLARLESDLRFQVRSAFRLRPREADKRLEQLDIVLKNFQTNASSNKDRQLMADWLLQATRHSMPGSMAPLPEVPKFGQGNVPAASKQIVASVPATTDVLPNKKGERSVVSELAQQAKSKASSVTPKASPTMPLPTIEPKPPTVESLPAPTPISTQLVSNAALPVVNQPKRGEVTLNMNELSARIAGYHLALDEMDAELYENPQPNVAKLSQFLEQLASVLQDYHFVKLYYESLNAQERRRVTEPRNMNRIVSGVRRRIQKLQRAIETDFLGEFGRSDAERVEQLNSQLDAVANRISW